MWRRLQEARGSQEATHRLVDALPIERRLALVGEVLDPSTSSYGLDHDCFAPRRLFPKLRGAGKKWAIAYADHLAAQPGRVDEELRYLVFLTLVRSRVPIRPEWDVLFPVGLNDGWSIECGRAMPEPRRARAIVAALEKHISAYTVDYALALLKKFPSAELTQGVYELGKKGRLPHTEAVKALTTIGKKHRVVREALEALKSKAPKAPALRCSGIVRLRDAKKLNSLQRLQIERAGKAYDGRKMTAAQWLEREKPGKEPTFAGRLEVATIVDATGRSLYEVYEYMGDSGTIYKAKTAKEVGSIIQGGLDAGDPVLSEAIRTALHAARHR
jgi:hypothetical protein